MSQNEESRSEGPLDDVRLCPVCARAEASSPIHVSDAATFVQYWRCPICAMVWATRGQVAVASTKSRARRSSFLGAGTVQMRFSRHLTPTAFEALHRRRPERSRREHAGKWQQRCTEGSA